MKSVYDLNYEDWLEWFTLISEPKYRAEQVIKALHLGTEINEIPNLPKLLRERIAGEFYVKLPIVVKEVASKDGTRKYLLKINAEGTLIECVFLTAEYGNTVCVSTQVGCKMACAFCVSGANGFMRNLTAGEILSQVILLNKLHSNSLLDRAVTNIVLMGSGEPFDNFDNTISFLRLVTDSRGINISARNISVSTAGLPDKIRQFADLSLQVNLCISLHAPNDKIRTRIMPIAKKHPIHELIEASKYFFEKTHRRVIFEYALIDSVNCEPEHAKELASLLRGFPAHVNLINLNAIEGSKLQSPLFEVAKRFMDTVIKNGVTCTMRKSKGDDIAGACGQLIAKFVGENDLVSSGKKGD